VHVTGSVISGANVTLSNIAGLNGVIHIIDAIITDRMNIWEYLLTQTGYDQISLIRSYDKEVMDMSKSVQTGVDIQGRPVYDTVWTMHNNFLQDYPLTDENQLFTCILLDNDALSLLKEKYSKYYLTPDAQQQELTVATELASDLLLKYQPVTQAGRFESVKDLLVDIDPANIRETYQASNGLVYKVSSADIKIYENKIKTQIIEAEDYVSRYASNDNAWARRYRSWANGGMDMMLKGITRNTVEYDTYDETGDSIIHSSVTFSYNTKYRDNDNIANNLSNAYLSYEPTLYSTAYEIYWMAFDDIEKHYTDFTDTLQQPMILEQKLFVSLPGEAALERKSDATVVNNFSTNTILAAKSVAGVFEESQLTRYTIATTPAGIYVLNEPYTGSDQFGDQYKLICPSYGKATFFVANTPREINANSGVMFLDYIKLVPLVDTND
jgi:hypothetical protein